MLSKRLIFSCFGFVASFFFFHCSQKQKEATAVIVKETLLDSIPSGSGMELYKDSLFIIGDDAGSIYQLSMKNNLYRKLPLHNTTTPVYRVDRDRKNDYESATMVNYLGGHYLLVFGSGSQSPARDSLLIFDADAGRVDTVLPVRSFYNHLMKLGNFPTASFNLEGAAVVDKRLVLFNRGNNWVFTLDAAKFIEYMLTKGTPPAIKHFRVTLPAIGKYEGRLSGAAVAGGDVLFCASVEETEDWTKDGPVAGSFIGIMDDQDEQLILSAKLVNADGKTAIEKLESVVLLSKEANGALLVLAIADNDDGKTKLLEIRVSERK